MRADVVRARRSATIAALIPEPTMHTSLSTTRRVIASVTSSSGSGFRDCCASGRHVSLPMRAS